MNLIAPYLRVVAGMFAAVCTWLVIVELVNGRFSESLVQLLFAVGLWYLAIGKPIRNHLARIRADNAALAARAQAGHEAYMAGDPAAFAPPPEAPQPPKVRRGVVIAAVAAAGLVLIGIASDIGDGLDNESKDDLTATSAPASVAAVAAPTEHAPATLPAAAAPAFMPHVVCMNLQDAQDTIQAAGVLYSRSADATGQGRAQISDRNWVVVQQSPAAGSTFGEGEAVLSVVKLGEPGDCS